MSVNSKIHSIDVLKYALKNFKMFHLSSEYKSFNSVSKIIREKKKPN